MPDLLDRTARQVRGYGNGPVRRLARAYTRRGSRVYETGCGVTLYGETALLTTTDTTCRACTVRPYGRRLLG